MRIIHVQLYIIFVGCLIIDGLLSCTFNEDFNCFLLGEVTCCAIS